VAHFEKKALATQAAGPPPLQQQHSGFTIAVPETEAGSEPEPATSLSSNDALPTAASALPRQASPPSRFAPGRGSSPAPGGYDSPTPGGYGNGGYSSGGFGSSGGGPQNQEAVGQVHDRTPPGVGTYSGGAPAIYTSPAGLAGIDTGHRGGGVAGYGSPTKPSERNGGAAAAAAGAGGRSPMEARIAAAAAAASASAMYAATAVVTSVAAQRRGVVVPPTPFGAYRTPSRTPSPEAPQQVCQPLVSAWPGWGSDAASCESADKHLIADIASVLLVSSEFCCVPAARRVGQNALVQT